MFIERNIMFKYNVPVAMDLFLQSQDHQHRGSRDPPDRSVLFPFGSNTQHLSRISSPFDAFISSNFKKRKSYSERKRMIIDKSREYSVPLYLERMNVRKPCLYQIRPGLVTIVLKPAYICIHTHTASRITVN